MQGDTKKHGSVFMSMGEGVYNLKLPLSIPANRTVKEVKSSLDFNFSYYDTLTCTR